MNTKWPLFRRKKRLVYIYYGWPFCKAFYWKKLGKDVINCIFVPVTENWRYVLISRSHGMYILNTEKSPNSLFEEKTRKGGEEVFKKKRKKLKNHLHGTICRTHFLNTIFAIFFDFFLLCYTWRFSFFSTDWVKTSLNMFILVYYL